MADPRSLPPVESAAFERDYKPVSGVAVAAICIALLFVVIAPGSAFAAFINKRPVLNLTLLLLAGAGWVTAVAARIHIRRSEGARIGLQVAAAAWWLSVIGGASFGAYYIANVFAIRQQAETAAREWFDLLKKRQFDRAFLLTVPPRQRQGINPDDSLSIEQRFNGPQLPAFRNSELVRFFKRDGDTIDATPIGVGEIDAMENGYRVELTFLLRSPEGAFELTMSVNSQEDPGGPGREWQISTGGNLVLKGLTAYGHLTNELQSEAFAAAQEWMAATQSRLAEDAVLQTLPPAEQAGFAAHLLEIRQGFPLPAFALGRLTSGKIDTTHGPLTFDRLWQRDFFKLEGPDRTTREKQNVLREVWDLGQFSPSASMRLANLETTPTMALDRNGIEYIVPINVLLPRLPPAYAAARFVLKCDSEEVLHQVEEVRLRAIASPGHVDRLDRPLEGLPPRHWRVVRFETNLETLQGHARPPAGAGDR